MLRFVENMTVFLVFALAFVIISVSTSSESDLSCRSMEEAAKLISKRIRQELGDERAVWIREFHPHGTSNTSIPKSIADDLIKQGIMINQYAKVYVRGDILPVKKGTNSNQRIIGYKVCFTIHGPGAKMTKQEIVEVANPENSDEAIGVVAETGEFVPSPVNPPRAPLASATIENGTKILPRPGAPYYIEILVDTDSSGRYVARKAVIESNGFPKVEMKKGELYAVKIHNDTEFDATVLVSIDGLSRFALSDKEQYRKFQGDLVRKKSHRTIVGYYRDTDTVHSFKIGEYTDSAASKLLPSPVYGDISVTFRALWYKGETAPPGEHGTSPASANATEAGPTLRDPTTIVHPFAGKTRTVIRVRY